jgi:hypothetical protein
MIVGVIYQKLFELESWPLALASKGRFINSPNWISSLKLGQEGKNERKAGGANSMRCKKWKWMKKLTYVVCLLILISSFIWRTTIFLIFWKKMVILFQTITAGLPLYNTDMYVHTQIDKCFILREAGKSLSCLHIRWTVENFRTCRIKFSLFGHFLSPR